jgi:hypothetical protein
MSSQLPCLQIKGMLVEYAYQDEEIKGSDPLIDLGDARGLNPADAAYLGRSINCRGRRLCCGKRAG